VAGLSRCAARTERRFGKLLATGLIAAQYSVGVPANAQATQQQPPQQEPSGIKIEAPSTIRVSSGDAIPVVLSSKKPATAAVGAGPFLEATRQKPLQSDLCLRSTLAQKGCEVSVTLSPNTLGQRWLIVRGNPEGGSYSGLIRLQTDGGERVDHQIAIVVQDAWWKWAGAIGLLAGIALSYLLTVWIPHSRDRERTIRQFLLLRARVEQAEAQLPVGGSTEVRKRAKHVRDVTTETSLTQKNLIPGRIPGSGNATADVEKRNAVLIELEKMVAGIELLANSIQNANPTNHGALDAIAGDPGFPHADLAARIDKAIGAKPVGRGARPISTEDRVQRLVFREEVRNGAYWLISSVVTALLGYVLLIDADQSFSGWSDVAAAFLWGLGLSTAGSKLGDLTPGQLRTALRGT
jgi:hypothetical protein